MDSQSNGPFQKHCYEQQQGSNGSLVMLLECFIMYKAFLYSLFHLTLTNVGIILTK